MRLAITRQLSQIDDIIHIASARGIEIVSLPLIKTENLKFKIDENKMRQVDWLFFSSVNGVHAFFERLRELDIHPRQETKIGAIGMKTAEALAYYGLKVDFVPEEAYGKNLFLEFLKKVVSGKETVMYSRAKKIVFDPECLFRLAGIGYYPVVSYEAREGDISEGVVSSLSETNFILFTAPSTIRSYHKKFGIPIARTIAIGRTTAKEMDLHNWQIFKIMDIPKVDMVLNYIGS